VESDPGEVDLSRVAGFLRKVDDGVTFWLRLRVYPFSHTAL
jgi:hypothetical protein